MMKKVIALLLAAILAVSMAAAFTGCDKNTEKGRVYYLNFKPEADEAWQALAAEYTEETGIEVKVYTAASGNYAEVLKGEMAKQDAPTLFQCGNAQSLKDWGDYCLDFTDTEVLKEMTTSDFNLVDESGAVKAIGYCYEAFGIIVNKTLLRQAGFEVSDLCDFSSLQAAAEDIHARSAELGFDAFASSGLESSSSWRFSGHLANMPLFYEFRDENITDQPATIKGTYLSAYKNVWDLYIQNSAVAPTELINTTCDMGRDEFGTGKAVFWQQGTWEYANLVGPQYNMDPEELQMIPIYCGVEGEEQAALCRGTENCWAVNAKAKDADIQATLDFLKWVVSSDLGTTMMAEQFGLIPFKAAKESPNVFCEDANKLVDAGKYNVTWAFKYTPNVAQWRAGVVAALADYSAGNGQWSAVETAFVDGWAAQYAEQNAN